jgi:hypothetical protein
MFRCFIKSKKYVQTEIEKLNYRKEKLMKPETIIKGVPPH